MIRDRIVVGIHDRKLSEKLQLDPTLTLDKAITSVRQAETVKKQQGSSEVTDKRKGSRQTARPAQNPPS